MTTPSTPMRPWQTPPLEQSSLSREHLPAYLRQGLEEMEAQAQEDAHKQGYQEGMAAAQSEMEQLQQQLSHVIQVIESPYRDINEAVVNGLAELAGVIARQLVLKELSTSTDTLLLASREAASFLPERSDPVRLRLCSEDISLFAQLDHHLALPSGWQLEEDETLQLGQCRLAAGATRINADLQARIAAIVSEVIDSAQQADSSGEEVV